MGLNVVFFFFTSLVHHLSFTKLQTGKFEGFLRIKIEDSKNGEVP